MSKAKHTKGPWNLGQYPDDPNYYVVTIDQTVCTTDQGFYSNPITTDEAKANANLIAAAPEMYQMLEQAVGALKQYWEYGEAMKEYGRGFQANYKGYSDYDLKVMEHILKKARGES